MQGSRGFMNEKMKKIHECRDEKDLLTQLSRRFMRFYIPVFINLLDPCIHGTSDSQIFLIIHAFMDLLDPCIHGSRRLMKTGIKKFMNHIDHCVNGSSSSLHSWIFYTTAQNVKILLELTLLQNSSYSITTTQNSKVLGEVV